MNTPTKLAGFGAILLVGFGAAAGVGAAVGPDVAESPADHATMEGMGENDGVTLEAAVPGDETTAVASSPALGGLAVSDGSYTLRLDEPVRRAGTDVPISLTILDSRGDAVTNFDVEHEKELHLIAVRRDSSGFQHVHPVMDSSGTWRTRLDLAPGDWRVFADMKPSGADKVTLGADLAVPGSYRPRAAATRDIRVDRLRSGYTVTLDGDLTPGGESELRLAVQRGGEPVTDLDPYLGAYGHLVALREGDLAYLHVHPDGEQGDGETEPGTDVTFYTDVPSAGGYRLFFDFRHEGRVRTASFVVSADPRSSRSAQQEPPPDVVPDADHEH